MSSDGPSSRDLRRADRGTAPKMPSLRTLTVMAASALLVPEAAMAAGPLGAGPPPAPAAAPRAAPALPPPVIVPQAPVVSPHTFTGPGTTPGGQFPSATAPSTPKGTGQSITLNGGDFGATIAPSVPKGAGHPITITGDQGAVTAPSVTTPAQKPSSSDRKR